MTAIPERLKVIAREVFAKRDPQFHLSHSAAEKIACAVALKWQEEREQRVCCDCGMDRIEADAKGESGACQDPSFGFYHDTFSMYRFEFDAERNRRMTK